MCDVRNLCGIDMKCVDNGKCECKEKGAKYDEDKGECVSDVKANILIAIDSSANVNTDQLNAAKKAIADWSSDLNAAYKVGFISYGDKTTKSNFGALGDADAIAAYLNKLPKQNGNTGFKNALDTAKSMFADVDENGGADKAHNYFMIIGPASAVRKSDSYADKGAFDITRQIALDLQTRDMSAEIFFISTSGKSGSDLLDRFVFANNRYYVDGSDSSSVKEAIKKISDRVATDIDQKCSRTQFYNGKECADLKLCKIPQICLNGQNEPICSNGKCTCTTSEKYTYIDKYGGCVPKVPTTNGDTGYDGVPCYFPFKYQGEVYHNCTIKNWGYPWCSTTADYGVERKWQHCSDFPIITFDGNVPKGTKCAIPFTYKGKTYKECPPYGSHRWCATTSTFDGKWGFCTTTHDNLKGK